MSDYRSQEQTFHNRTGKAGDMRIPPAEAQAEQSRGPAEGAASDRMQLDGTARVEMAQTLAAGIAHEFNNLTTIMLASLDLLRHQPLDDAGRGHLERAEWCSQQAAQLTGQMLALVRPGNGQLRLLDLGKVVSTFDKMIHQAAGYESGLNVSLELSSQLLPVRLDPVRLELVLLNLVRNTAAAMAGNGTLTVRTAGHLADGLGAQATVDLSIVATGAAIPPDVVQQITTPGLATQEPNTGIGRGLRAAQRFVSGYEGRLAIETPDGCGTTVRLIFPRADQA
jgi:signal transduction histidine kinase